MKFNTLIIAFIMTCLLSVSAFAEKFDSQACLKSNYKTEIKNEGKFFGLIKNNLMIDKTECIIKIKYKNILETEWKIDICREPIHIKVRSKGTESVYKRDTNCSGEKRSDYCEYWDDLDETLQDYGLIFAEGERELLTTPHGQVYCSYLLIKKYLNEGVLFSKYNETPLIFSGTSEKRKESCAIEKTTSIVDTEPMSKTLMNINPVNETAPENSQKQGLASPEASF